MAYAPDARPFYDADSHIMELPNFLTSYADPDIRDDIPEVSYSASIVTDEEVAEIMAQGGKGWHLMKECLSRSASII